MQKIMVVGPGGTGGFIAGQLSKYTSTEVTLVARGESLRAISKNGLTVITDEETYTTHPTLTTDAPATAGVQDAIILCTKSYGLKQALEQIRPCVGEHTLLLPLLNGISAYREICESLGTGVALSGCIYIFSQILAPGTIKRTGALCKIEFGIPAAVALPESASALCALLSEAHIPAFMPENYQGNLWMKWLLMLSNAQAASYFNMPIGPMREDPEKYAFVMALLDEALLVAAAEGVALPADARELTIGVISRLAYESTPSLSRDLNTPNKPTELDVFGGELLRLAKKHGLSLPCNEKLIAHFADRI